MSNKHEYSGILILAASVLLLLSFGYRSGFGLFVKPITEANGWGREVVSMALAVQNLFWGIVAVFAGGLADRFGNLKVIVAGTILYDLVWWLGVALGIFAAFVHWPIRERPVRRLAAATS